MKSPVHSIKLVVSLTVAYFALFTCMQMLESVGVSETLQLDRHQVKLRRDSEVKRKERKLKPLEEHHTEKDQLLKETTTKTALPRCPEPFKPGSTIPVNKTVVEDLHHLSKKIATLPGGKWHPVNCRSKYKVAILVPYRNRAHMLGTWLQHMHPFLQKQLLHYGIYIIEQDFAEDFNRGALLNIGAKFALKNDHYDCIILHDIDYLPEKTSNYYGCPSNPTHFGTKVECKGWKKLWPHHFGGVSAIRVRDFLKVNGYSNGYFGWGSEDDDLAIRLYHEKLNMTQRDRSIGIYRCLSHQQAEPGKGRYRLYTRAANRYKKEGFNSVSYELIKYMEMPLYTWIYVHLDKEKTRNAIWQIVKKICVKTNCTTKNIWTKHNDTHTSS